MLLSADSGVWGVMHKETSWNFSLFCEVRVGWKEYTLENYSFVKDEFQENENRSICLLVVLYFSFSIVFSIASWICSQYSIIMSHQFCHIYWHWSSNLRGADSGKHFFLELNFSKTVMGHRSFIVALTCQLVTGVMDPSEATFVVFWPSCMVEQLSPWTVMSLGTWWRENRESHSVTFPFLWHPLALSSTSCLYGCSVLQRI